MLPIIGVFPLGFVLGTPTIFAGSNYFLASVNLFLLRNATYPTKWTAYQTFSLDLFGSQGFERHWLIPSAEQTRRPL